MNPPASSGNRRRFARLAAGTLAVAAVLAPSGAVSAPLPGDEIRPGPVLDVQKVAAAPADECFQSIGGARPTPSSDGTCPTGFQPKINESYIWSGARSGDYAYFGTLSNLACGVVNWTLDATPQLIEDVNVCEYGQGPNAAALGPLQGDVRTPSVMRVNADTQAVENITPKDDPLLKRTAGLRGAASHNDVVILYGQLIGADQTATSGLAMFAFEGSTGRFLGSHGFTDIVGGRGGVVASDGNLYLAARLPGTGGAVLRWRGDKENPFRFETVANLGNDAGYLTTVGNRLAVSGWVTQPSGKLGAAIGGPSKIWMSPEIPATGLTTEDADDWKPIFSWDDYDPDPAVSKGMNWGALTMWRGELYVGSYNPAGLGALQTHWATNGRPTGDALRTLDMMKANRAATIFKIQKPGTAQQKVTLLYGEANLPVYNPTTKLWVNKPNKLGQLPKFGPSGFNGNPGNMYSWTFSVFKDKLYMSTFDASGVTTPVAPFTAQVAGFSPMLRDSLQKVVGPVLKTTLGGGDVWRMDDPSRPAVAETLNGFGNRSEHGVRVFLPFEDKGHLYAGMAGSWNLRATDVDRGGWELNALTPGATRPPLRTALPAEAAKAALSSLPLFE